VEWQPTDVRSLIGTAPGGARHAGSVSSGHDGALCTCTQVAPEEALWRLETLVLMVGAASRTRPSASRWPQRFAAAASASARTAAATSAATRPSAARVSLVY
jgi:hypothetical protein